VFAAFRVGALAVAYLIRAVRAVLLAVTKKLGADATNLVLKEENNTLILMAVKWQIMLFLC
jgi:hypothetical protein